MFEEVVLDGDVRPLLDGLTAGIAAIEPRRCVAAAVRRDRDALVLGGQRVALPDRPVRVLGLGKAAIAMAWGLHDALGQQPLRGAVATPVPGPAPAGLDVVTGGHPVPDAGSLAAGERLLAEASAASSGDLVVVLVSGGGSACAEVPPPGVGLEALAGLNRLLLASGAPIGEVNTVRRAVSRLKGGRLATAAAPAAVVTVIVSDVVGNDLPTIAGGPTVADRTGAAEAAVVLDRYGLSGRVDPTVLAVLDKGAAAPPPEPGPLVIAADGGTAAAAAAEAARRHGIEAAVIATDLTGAADRVGRSLAGATRAGEGPEFAVYAGETTVTLGPAPGRGGRNQEVALAAAPILAGTGGIVASLGTDGVDGPTDAAGGVSDGATVERGRRAGLDAAAALAAHDSGRYLERVGGRLVCGPTGTNVGDLLVAWRR